MHPTQGRTAAALGTLVLALALTGCTGTASPAPTVTRTALVTVTPSPSPTAEFSIPSPGADEITRSTYAYGQTTENSAALPTTGPITVKTACASDGGGSMRYAMVDDQGVPAGLSGTIRCDGRPQTAAADLGTDRPGTVRMQLTPVGQVDAAYALLSAGPTGSPSPTGAPTDTPVPGATSTPAGSAPIPSPRGSSS